MYWVRALRILVKRLIHCGGVQLGGIQFRGDTLGGVIQLGGGYDWGDTVGGVQLGGIQWEGVQWEGVPLPRPPLNVNPAPLLT